MIVGVRGFTFCQVGKASQSVLLLAVVSFLVSLLCILPLPPRSFNQDDAYGLNQTVSRILISYSLKAITRSQCDFLCSFIWIYKIAEPSFLLSLLQNTLLKQDNNSNQPLDENVHYFSPMNKYSFSHRVLSRVPEPRPEPHNFKPEPEPEPELCFK